MKLIFAFIFIISFYTGPAFAQDDLKEFSNTEIGIIFSPDFSHRIIGAGYFAWQGNNEIPTLGYTTGFSIIKNLNKKFAIESGLYYANKGYKTRMQTYRVNDDTDYIFNDLKGFSFSYSYYYLDIPFKLNYYIVRKKVSIYFTLGVSGNIYLRNESKSITHFNDGNTQPNFGSYEDKFFRRVNLSTLAGIAFTYKLSDKFKIKLEPIYRQSFISVTKSSFAQAYLYSLGINTGIVIRL